MLCPLPNLIIVFHSMNLAKRDALFKVLSPDLGCSQTIAALKAYLVDRTGNQEHCAKMWGIKVTRFSKALTQIMGAYVFAKRIAPKHFDQLLSYESLGSPALNSN